MIGQIFSFKGRLSRLGFLAYYLLGMGVLTFFGLGLQQVYLNRPISSSTDTLVLFLIYILILAALIAAAAGSARRFHDIGWSAWWLVFGLASMFALAAMRAWMPEILQQAIPVLLLLAPGQTGANRYGAAISSGLNRRRFNPRQTLTR